MLVVLIMVKNEESVIVPTLETYRKGGISNFMLYDTGSTDKTIENFEEFVKQYSVNGKVYQLPFVDFSTSRNSGLKKVKELFPECVFAFMPDAEWYIQNAEGLVKYCQEHKDDLHDHHHISLVSTDMEFKHSRLFRIGGNSCFKHPVHEVAYGSVGGSIPISTSIEYRPGREGHSKTLDRWYRDLGLLLKATKSPEKDPRDVFYLAQTYECLGQQKEAIHYYVERFKMEGFIEEKFMALYRIGKLYEFLSLQEDKSKTEKESDWNNAQTYYLKAYEFRPSRIEPLVRIAQHHFNPQLKYMFAKQACTVPMSTDLLFVEHPLYNFDRWDQLGIGAWYMEKYVEGYDAVMRAIKIKPHLTHLKSNHDLYKAKLEEMKMLPPSLETPSLKTLSLNTPKVKILNLILYSPGFEKMYTILSEYLKSEGVPHFFYIFQDDLGVEHKIVDDILYIKGKETFIPGILDKTLKAFEIFKDKEYDYIVRSNASTVVNFALLKQNLSEKIDYGGPLYYVGSRLDLEGGLDEEKHAKYKHHHFVSGICIVLSKKAIELLVQNQEAIRKLNIIDDVSIGIHLHDKGLIRKTLGTQAYSFDNDVFKPGMIAYRNKTDDRNADAEKMQIIVQNLKK